ncbi:MULTISPECIES: PPC domain-containing protein [Trichocoleus]|uniref:PPC domain-containing protein n=1 Tax=Trichocoleus desertorum GB2-A4 TaxID=2933944 RepID=A0ABV0JAU3_9CYAN|nr:PPC domain-containing protein [Trichocoleus sp. FACHB-46]MBD1863144.1 PPC domain-containing protein [Trichocoleus sp. FACHB-46]
MNFVSNLWKTGTVAALGALFSVGLPLVVRPAIASYAPEQEPNNDLFTEAQSLDSLFSLDWDEDILNSLEIPHASIWGSGFSECITQDECLDEFDFYSFTVPTGKRTFSFFDIDRTTGDLDTQLFLFDRIPDLTLLAFNDDALASLGAKGSQASCSIFDPNFSCDSFLGFNLSNPGTYYLGVNFIPPATAGRIEGNYTLHVSLRTEDVPASVPEPASGLGLLSVGALGARAIHKRKKATGLDQAA